MKTGIWIVALAVAAIGIAVFLNNDSSPWSSPQKTSVADIRPQPSPAVVSQTTLLPIAETAASLNSPETTPQDDIATLDLMLAMFRKSNGGNPVGENDEITAALLGKNPKRLAFLPAEGNFLGSDAQLIDRWGTPYFFHALSGKEMRIFSAGPDRKHHTQDDITSD